MARTARISISLPAETLRIAERERRATGESRSEFFRRAIDELVRRRHEGEALHRYLAGYIAEPEAAEEEWVDRLARDRLEKEPWD